MSTSPAAPPTHRCGHVAVVGRPNVGKSTLVNRLVGYKLSITSRKAQTTRHRLLGIKTGPDAQIVYVDTPGIHAGHKRALNRYMNRVARNALVGVDVVLMLVEAPRWTGGDSLVLERLREARAPVILAINKIDRLDDKATLLPFIEEAAARAEFAEIVPISARRGTNIERLEREIVARLPEAPAVYDEDQFTDRSERFLVSEIIREKLTERLGEELPYRLSVEIERFESGGERIEIGAVIWVERPGQKAIVIGREGEMLKAAGSAARRDAQALLGRRVRLELWVKVKAGWSDDERALRRLGYVE